MGTLIFANKKEPLKFISEDQRRFVFLRIVHELPFVGFLVFDFR